MALTDDELRRLRAGFPVKKQERDGQRGCGLFVVDVQAPSSVVMRCLQEFERYPQVIPVVREATVRARGREQDGCIDTLMNYKVSKFWLNISVRHVVDSEAGKISFDLDQSSNKVVLKEASGVWHVEPSPESGKTRVWLQVALRASRVVPHWIVDYAAERALRRATAWLKPHVEDLTRRQGSWRGQRSESQQGFLGASQRILRTA